MSKIPPKSPIAQQNILPYAEIKENTMYLTETSIQENLAPNEAAKSTHCNSPNQTRKNKELLSQLPKITHKNFTGKDLCTICYKVVRKSHQGISCSSCGRQTHRNCCNRQNTIPKAISNKMSQVVLQ